MFARLRYDLHRFTPYDGDSQWTADDIGGYPVIRATDEMISKYGSCKLLLGVADDAVVAVIDVEIDSSAHGPDCRRADRAAGMALATLR